MNRFFALLAALLTTVPLYAADTPLFDGKTFTAGAVVGITTTAGAPSVFAASATAWPWLPDE